MAAKLLSVVLLGVLASQVSGYSRGAPESDSICKSMTPKHPGAPQTSTSPYNLQLSSNQVSPGGQVTLTISGETFKGFLVQGRNSNWDEDMSPVGQFVPSGTNANLQKTISCGYPGASITHTSGVDKSSMTVTWTAPKQTGSYVLLTTVVQDGATYWVRIPSETINVV